MHLDSKLIKRDLTFKFHAASQTLVKSASRTLLASSDGDRTVPPSETHVVLAVLHRSLEETLARLTREYAVVEAADLVSADWAWTGGWRKVKLNYVIRV